MPSPAPPVFTWRRHTLAGAELMSVVADGDRLLLVDGRRLLLYGIEFETRDQNALWEAVHAE